MVNTNLEEPDGTPGEVRSLAAASGAGKATLTWIEPTDTDYDHAEISYSAGNGPIEVLPVSIPKGVHEFTIEYLAYGITYAITVKLVDVNGNKSVGSLIIVTMPRVVDDLNLAPYITAPMQGVLPDKRLITGTQYTGTVSWYVMISGGPGAITGNPPIFTLDKEYQVKAYLTPNPGYTFADLAENSFTYGGAATVVTNAISGLVTVTFPSLGKAWFVANYGSDDPDPVNGTSSETPLKTVTRALVLISADHTDGSPLTSATIAVIGTSKDRKTILIDNTTNIYPPITLRGLSPTQPGILTADKTPTTDWDNPDAVSSYRVMTITGGARVTMGNDLTITGGGQRAYVSAGAGVYVHDNGIANPFTMNGGTITGNKSHTSGAGWAGGVYVKDTSAFIMNGGVVSNNSGFHTGGVAIYNDSTFTMNGGTITNNEAEHGGGGLRIMNGSTFTMNGGVISANKVTDGFGGGIYIYDASFTMNGGAVSGHTAKSCGGIDIDNNATFIMDGGSITDNTSFDDYGGGVGVLNSSSFIMHGGTIARNTAKSQGGGVAVTGGAFKKEPLSSGGASGIIYGNDGGANNNTATSAATTLLNSGHAVYIAPEAGGLKTREISVTAYQSLDSASAEGWAE
jgi:hypothetical protein